MPESINLTLVVDNLATAGLAVEHGFSAWIEAGGVRILFDTGEGPALAHNAKVLGVPLQTANFLVLSHGHYDHTGGIPHVLECAPAIQLYGHPAITRPRFAVHAGRSQPIGMTAAACAALERLSPERWHRVTQPLELAPGIGLTGPIPRNTDYEDVGGPFFLDRAGEVPDPLEDDLALWLPTARGLVVVVGCSHAGLINTLRHVGRVSGTSKIHAILGGFHLLAADDRRLEQTLQALRELNPDRIVPCHCTGEGPMRLLGRAFGDRVTIGSAGSRFAF